MMYNGPHRSDFIDAPLLSRFFYDIDTHVGEKIKVYVLGGTALTLLGLRKEGSKDVDITCQEHWHEFQKALGYTINNIRSEKIYIPITRDKKEIQRYYFPRDAVVQTFGTYLTENKRLPEDFHKYAHRIKRIEWVMPEGGQLESMLCDELFERISLYTLGLADIFCTKIFGLRERDREDLKVMLEKKGFYFRLHKKFVQSRLKDFWKANKATSEKIKKGAIATYNAFQDEYPNHLLPLKLS